MTRATGHQYQHILELVDWASAEYASGPADVRAGNISCNSEMTPAATTSR